MPLEIKTGSFLVDWEYGWEAFTVIKPRPKVQRRGYSKGRRESRNSGWGKPKYRRNRRNPRLLRQCPRPIRLSQLLLRFLFFYPPYFIPCTISPFHILIATSCSGKDQSEGTSVFSLAQKERGFAIHDDLQIAEDEKVTTSISLCCLFVDTEDVPAPPTPRCFLNYSRAKATPTAPFSSKYFPTKIPVVPGENRLVFPVESLLQYSRAELFIDFYPVHGNEL